MPASPAAIDCSPAAPAGSGGGTAVRVAALTPSRPAVDGVALAREVRFVVAAAPRPRPGLQTAMARAGQLLLQSGLESPDALNMDKSVAGGAIDRSRHATHDGGVARPMRRRSRRYAERHAGARAGR